MKNRPVLGHQVIIPRAPQPGQPTGQRVHKPAKITKVFDKSSPLLLSALTSGERLTDLTVSKHQPALLVDFVFIVA